MLEGALEVIQFNSSTEPRSKDLQGQRFTSFWAPIPIFEKNYLDSLFITFKLKQN